MEGAAFLHMNGYDSQRPSMASVDRRISTTDPKVVDNVISEKQQERKSDGDNIRPTLLHTGTKPTRPKARNYFKPKIRKAVNGQRHMTDHNIYSRVKRIDITRSQWIHDPKDRDREIVTLHIKNDEEDESARRSFRWIHYQRDISPLTFEDFERLIGKTEGLYTEEAAVATKCLKEVRTQRRNSARGRYFDHTITQASTTFKKGGEEAPVKATFISMPVFAIFEDQDAAILQSQYPTSEQIRHSDLHPIRSLLQCSNILAIDSERDRAQVIRKMGADSETAHYFICVPEMWALVINSYTMITCAPFDIPDLCGQHVHRKMESISGDDFQHSYRERKTIVKYTDLKGTLRDLECKTWFNLLGQISRIEGQKEDLRTLLNDPNSDYKIVDLQFQPVDKFRWIDIVEWSHDHPEFVHLRLLKVVKNDPLNIHYAQKKLQAYNRTSMMLVASKLVLQAQEKRLDRLRKSKARPHVIDKVEKRIGQITEQIALLGRSRYWNRFMLYATRYHLINPQRSKKYRWIIPKKAKNGIEEHLTSHRSRTPSPSRGEFLQLSPEPSRPVSPTHGSFGYSGEEGLLRRQSLASQGSRTAQVPQIFVNDESFDPPSPVPVGAIPYAQFSPMSYMDARPPPPVTGLKEKKAVTVTIDTRPSMVDFVVESDPKSTMTDRPRPPRPRRSSTTAFIRSVELDDDNLSQVGDDLPSITRPASKARRHSTTATMIQQPAILDASPQRKPLGSERDPALQVSARKLLPPSLKWRSFTLGGKNPSIEHTARPPVSESESVDEETSQTGWHLSTLASERIAGAAGRLTPFFEWQSGKTNRVHKTGERTIPHNPHGSHQEPQSPTQRDQADVIAGNAMQILDHIDILIDNGDYFHPQQFPVGRVQYNMVQPKSAADVIDLIEEEHAQLYPTDGSADNRADIEAERQFHEIKVDLFLSVYGLLRCFIHQDRHRARIIMKVWGIVFSLCNLSAADSRSLPYPHRHEIKFMQLAKLQMKKFEDECCELLKDVRPEAGEEETSVNYSLPPPLLPAFRNIVVYLLCTLKATTLFGAEAENLDFAAEATEDLLRDAEEAFLRMTEHVEAEDDEFAEESLRTADTLLALLMENAFDISNKDMTRRTLGDGPHFDIRHLYSEFTNICINRAKQEASARVYKDLRLLQEELKTIKEILDQQRDTFNKMFQKEKREAAMQKLDGRVRRRTLDHLNDMSHHFQKLYDHARQAEFWTRQSIEVRGEDNNKAIYVFTAVTVIFLPLSFVTGLLGMNTIDIRSTNDKQWLFWVVAVPFTICVLLVCLCIVQYKFRFRKRTNSTLRWMIGCCGMQRRRRRRMRSYG